MYFVEQREIHLRLELMTDLLREVDAIRVTKTYMANLALERVVALLIESILDIGHMLIDGFIMRDAASFADIIHVLADEAVITEEASKAYLEFILLRKTIVKDYVHINHELLQDKLIQHKTSLEHFPQFILTFLERENNVAHTFKNEMR